MPQKEFPKERRENVEWRREILSRCAEDLAYRSRVKELFHRDVLFAFNAFFYTYDPRKRPFPHLPFCTWDYQDDTILEVVDAVGTGNDVLLEKSRDMGATWMVLGAFYWLWLKPEGGYDFLVGSRIEDYVDKRGDMRTHFEKFRYLKKRTPRWLLPKGWNDRTHDNFMRLVNPETGSSITGESNNPNFSTQGRYAAVLFDEFAKWESTDKQAWTSAGDATPCRIPVSTPFGAAGQYYDLATGGKIRRIRLHWSLHPEKSKGISCLFPPPNDDDRTRMGEHFKPDEKLVSPWYDNETERRQPTEIAQELDIDYIGAGNPVFDGKAMASLKYYRALPEEPKYWVKMDLEGLTGEKIEKEPFNPEGYLIVYRAPSPTDWYSIGWDIVEGVEDGDYLVGTVFNRITKDIDAIYYSTLDEVMASRVVKIVSDWYTPKDKIEQSPWVGIETNGPGLATFDLALLLGVVNLFMAPRYDTSKGSVSYKKGWRTDTNSRNELIAGVRRYLIDRAGYIHSQRLIGEMLTFVRSRTGKPQAKAGTHDDMVFSFGIALQVDEIAPLDYEDIKAAKVKQVAEANEFRVTAENRESFRNEDDVMTLEERCLATVLQRRDLRDREDMEFYGNL